MNWETELQTVADILQEMKDTDYQPFIVDGLISSGMTTVAGRPKSGKTYLTVDIARSLITGEPFLGREVHKTFDRVAFLCTDAGGKREIAGRLARAGLDPSRVFAMPLETPDSSEEWRNAVDAFRRLRVGAVIVDNTSDLAADANNPRDVKIITDGLRRWADNSTVVLNVHHTGKDRSLFGSTVWEKMTRSILTLERAKAKHTLKTKSNEAASEVLDLRFSMTANPFYTRVSDDLSEARERQRTDAWMDENKRIWAVLDAGKSYRQAAADLRVTLSRVQAAVRARRKAA